MKKEIEELERLIELYRSNNVQDNYSEIILQLNEILQKNMGFYLPCKESGDGYDIKTLTGDDGLKYLIACTSDKEKEDGVTFVYLTFKEILDYIVANPLCSGMCLNQIEHGNQIVINKEYARKLLTSLEHAKNAKNSN